MHTKKLLFVFFFTCYAILAAAQNFEGTLTYKVDVELGETFKALGLTKEMMMEKMAGDGLWADTVKVTYKNGNYLNHPLTAEPADNIYRADSNKLYALADDICVVTDAAVDLQQQMTNTPPTITKLDTVAMINDTKCNVVRVKWKMGYTDYFYAENVNPISPTFYSEHKHEGFGPYLTIAKALPVRIEKSVMGTLITFTLIETQLHKVDDSLFVIPELEEAEDLSILDKLNMKTMKVKH